MQHFAEVCNQLLRVSSNVAHSAGCRAAPQEVQGPLQRRTADSQLPVSAAVGQRCPAPQPAGGSRH